eukprot:gene48-4298_t
MNTEETPTINKDQLIFVQNQFFKTGKIEKNVPRYLYFELLLQNVPVEEVLLELLDDGTLNLGKYEKYYMKKVVSTTFDENTSEDLGSVLMKIFAQNVIISGNTSHLTDAVKFIILYLTKDIEKCEDEQFIDTVFECITNLFQSSGRNLFTNSLFKCVLKKIVVNLPMTPLYL